MFEGRHCRYLSTTEDKQLHRQMGTRHLDEFIPAYVNDAASPEQLDALAFQLLCVARRCKTAGIKDTSRRWKQAWRDVSAEAASARARLANHPTQASAPHLFNKRTVGKPGHLDSDLRLPIFARLELGRDSIPVGIYEPDLRDGVTYAIGGSRSGKTWLTPADGAIRTSAVPTGMLRGLQQLGRLIPVDAPDECRLAA
ncbi:hypothetical protein [Sphingosinicella sp. BN140058]|uniref:hypothetical protein n=1 Tax=Sphingosinicella sp. BN140058 TaxID=1892855 RepID=UPI001010884D|nr:hypothetical protein [Sphingosinicella sp. BN140058]QAY80371.1 hypothetical protein ETR14_27410 [Sphingosinicella sp. BN140058]